MSVFLETKNLIIKTPQAEDFDNLYALQTDADVMKYIGQGVTWSHGYVSSAKGWPYSSFHRYVHKVFDKRIIRIKKDIPAFGGGAENIACFKLPPKAVVQKWLTSKGHKRNIEGNYNRTGTGIIQDEKGWIYYTQIFVKDNGVKQA